MMVASPGRMCPWLADILWCCLSVPLVAVVAPVVAPVAVVALVD